MADYSWLYGEPEVPSQPAPQPEPEREPLQGEPWDILEIPNP